MWVELDEAEPEVLVAAVLETFEKGTLQADLFADDLLVDLNVPRWRFQLEGPAALRDYLAREVQPSNIDSLRAVPMPDGFYLEVAIRNGAAYARQSVLVETAAGLVKRMTLYSTGYWETPPEPGT